MRTSRSADEIAVFLQFEEADQGVDRGPGGPPHKVQKLVGSSARIPNKANFCEYFRTFFGCTKLNAVLHRHLTILPQLGRIVRGACSREKE